MYGKGHGEVRGDRDCGDCFRSRVVDDALGDGGWTMITFLTAEQQHQHPNGGGWVANTAWVSESAYVGSSTQVYDYAWVFGDAQLSGNAWVSDNALL